MTPLRSLAPPPARPPAIPGSLELCPRRRSLCILHLAGAHAAGRAREARARAHARAHSRRARARTRDAHRRAGGEWVGMRRGLSEVYSVWLSVPERAPCKLLRRRVRFLPRSGQLRPTSHCDLVELGPNVPKCGNIWRPRSANAARIGQPQTVFDRCSVEFGAKFGPNSTKVGAISTHVDQYLPGIDQHWAGTVQDWPKFGQTWPSEKTWSVSSRTLRTLSPMMWTRSPFAFKP